MIIYTPKITRKNEQSILSAKIVCKTSKFPFPKELFFSFPQAYEDCMLLRGDAFLAGTIIPAMALGESIEIDAPVSPRLIEGLVEFQKILVIWFPKQLAQVQIKYSNLDASTPELCYGDTASLYSGGVDSSYILRANLAPQQAIKDFQIKHAIFIHGADIPLDKPEYFAKLSNLAMTTLEKAGVNLIPCSTNVRSFAEGLIKWNYSHGPALLSAGLALSGLLKRLYIASSYNYRNLIPWGSSPLLDHLLSTETLEIVHYGASKRRTEKIKAIANWEPAHEFLHVCIKTDPGEHVNCERCDKCLGTKAMLEMEGVLDNFRTFKRPFLYRDYFRWAWNCAPKTVIPGFVLRESLISRHWKVMPFALLVTISRFVKGLMDQILPVWLRKKLRNQIYPLEKNPFYAENLPEA